jgi:hypothetical protein
MGSTGSGVGVFVNNTAFPMVIIGANFAFAIGTTVSANTFATQILISDLDNNNMDSLALIGANYVAVPASGGTIFTIGLLKNMYLPPNAKVSTFLSGLAANINLSIVACNTVKDAMMLLA